MAAPHHDIDWFDYQREPKVAPDPAYPMGKDVGDTEGAKQACKVMLPYPAKRVGLYVVTCQRCGLRVGVTTAGRPDDPRSVTIACKTKADADAE